MEAIIPNDSDMLVRLPTGEGKSVLFQVPALVRGLKTQRLTIVVTPLRALMADQVRSLWGMGFFQSVDYISGDRDPWITSEVYQGIIDNRIKLFYIAPERFRIPRFREALSRRLEHDQSFEYVVIDEAHCISQWGFEFRPDYLYAIKELSQTRPLMLLKKKLALPRTTISRLNLKRCPILSSLLSGFIVKMCSPNYMVPI
jgi:superfamily II DNA helicase RecQ